VEKENKNQEEKNEFISLSEVAKIIGYTPEYLNLLSRKKKLKAEKIGRNWYTKKRWLNDFLAVAPGDGSKQGENKISCSNFEAENFELPEKVTEAREVEKREKEKADIFSFQQESKQSQKLEEANPELGKKWLKIFSFMSVIMILVPMIFLVIYSLKNFSQKRDGELERILENQIVESGIMNENSQLGKVAGEENLSQSNSLVGKTALASENFRINDINIGGDILVLENGENSPMEIYNVKSESFVANKKDEVKLVVSWKTNKMGNSQISYSKNNAQKGKDIKEDSYGFNHSVVISDLEPRTSYVYQIKCRDRWGNEVESNNFGIYTASKPVSVFDLIANAIGEVFGWALKK